MTDSPSNGTVSPWWALLVVPIGLLIGWGIALLPQPAPAPLAEPVARPVQATPGPPGAGVSPSSLHGGREASPTPAPLQPTGPPPSRAEVSSWTSLSSALEQSRRNGKPVLLDFNAEWCPPCQRMKQQVFDDGARGHEVRTAVIPVSIVDRSREDGRNPHEIESLQRQYGVQAFPTLVVFSPATGRALSKRGFGDPDVTLAWIKSAAASVR